MLTVPRTQRAKFAAKSFKVERGNCAVSVGSRVIANGLQEGVSVNFDWMNFLRRKVKVNLCTLAWLVRMSATSTT